MAQGLLDMGSPAWRVTHRETQMKSLVLALAATASVLGTGCGSPPCQRNVTLDWSGGFLGADGVQRLCANANVAGVAFVDLFINNDASTAARFNCTSYAAQAVDVGSGTNLYTVEGVEAGGRIAFRVELAVAAGCGNQTYAVTPAEGTLALDYSLPGNACFAPDSRIFSEVRDDIANQIAFVDSSSTSSPLCAPSPAPAPTYLLPAGNFTLIGVNEFSQSSGGIVGADCTQRAFQIAGASTTTVTPAIVNSGRACF
jgi:hypothetical protein